MRFMLIGGQEEEFLDTVIFPFRQKLVQGPVEGFAPEPGRSGVALLARTPDPIAKGRGQQDSGPSGDFQCHAFGDEGVGSEGQVRAVLDQGTDGKYEAWVPGQDSPHLRPGEVVKGP